MNVEMELSAWKKKTITKSELEHLLQTNSVEELYTAVSSAVADGILVPVKSSGTNGNRVYPLYLKYRITLKSDGPNVYTDIAAFHPAMIKNGYLQTKPKLYAKYSVQLKQLNAYLFENRIKVFISKKERSFDIFGEEKQLENGVFCGLLKHMGLNSETLGYYETPEYCFNDYIPERKESMVLLILENKDIWFNIRRRMYEDGARELLGTKIDGIVYGCGNQVSKKGALTGYTHFMDASKVQYLYWGDIDRAGLNIFHSVRKNNSGLDIDLFVPAYEEMLRLSENRTLPDSEDGRPQTDNYSEIYQLFSDDKRTRLIEIIENNKRLPQEIVNYEYLLDAMR